MDGIPLGQPILVGHHSERRARRDAERIDNGIRRMVEEHELADHHRAVAAGIAAWGSWRGCALYFSHSVSLSAYGALACIPAFLLWVFVAWCCVLFGVQVAAKAQPLCPGGRRLQASDVTGKAANQRLK